MSSLRFCESSLSAERNGRRGLLEVGILSNEFALCGARRAWKNCREIPTPDRGPTIREKTMKTAMRLTALCLLFAGSALALTGERFAEIPLDKMTPAQRAVADAILSGPRGRVSGPFNAWLRSPELADRLQKVGEYVRFSTSLDKRLNEMAILMTAQYLGHAI
jgi:hypothetical protein